MSSKMDKGELEKRFIEMIKQNERVIYKVCSCYASDDDPLSMRNINSILNSLEELKELEEPEEI